MKKKLSRILVAVMMGTTLFPAVGNAANPTTAQEKYAALEAKGIFNGINGEAALDQNMTRAQFARVAALILGLDGIGNPDTKVVTEKPFSDVSLNHWAAEEITAAKEAGLFDGYTDGTFKPGRDVTIQELAVVVAGLLNLEPVEGAAAEGAADWSAGYIQALIKAGVSFPTGYTEPAKRADLVSITYQVEEAVSAQKEAEEQEDEKEEEENLQDEGKEEEKPLPQPTSTPEYTALSIVEAKQVGLRTFHVKFNRKAGAAIRISVARNGNSVDVQASPNGANGYDLTFDENLSEGTYTVSAINADTSTMVSTASVYATAERIAKIELTAASDTIALSNAVVIPLRVTNQFGEAAEDVSGIEVISPSYSSSIDPIRTAVIVDTSIGQTNGPVSISVMHRDSVVSATRIFVIGDAPIVSRLEVQGTLRDTDGQEVSHAAWNQRYLVNFDAYDQYGSLLLPSVLSLSEQITLTSSLDKDQISFETVGAALSGQPGALSLPVTLLSSGQGGNYTLTMTSSGGGSTALIVQVADALGVVAAPAANVPSGAVLSGTSVSLSSVTDGATIYYTTDGSAPSTGSMEYSYPITITGAATIKAIAVKAGWTNSPVASYEYTIAIPIELPESIQSTSPLIVGQPYTGSAAKLSGGTGDITYTVTDGALPPGLTLDPNTGTISGTPTTSGSYSFTIHATDSASSATVSRPYNVTIAPESQVLTHLTSDQPKLMFTEFGDSAELVIRANFNDSTSSVVTGEAEFHSSDISVVTVSPEGVIAAVGNGTANIVVTYGARSIEVPVLVFVDIQLAFLSTSVASVQVPVGQLTNITVFAIYDNGFSSLIVTEWATFEVVDPAIASIDANGFITGLSPGETTIKVTFQSGSASSDKIIVKA